MNSTNSLTFILDFLSCSYRHHAYSITDLAATLLTRLQSITNHVTLLLSSTRNRLLNLEITIAFTTLGMSAGALIGALFGMNLQSGIEETPHVFAGVSIAAILLAIVIARWGRRALRKARSVKGEQEGLMRHSLPGWRKRLGRTPRQ
jgi:magnesium transporter